MLALSGGELLRNNYSFGIYTRLGKDTNVEIREGKNLNDFDIDINTEKAITPADLSDAGMVRTIALTSAPQPTFNSTYDEYSVAYDAAYGAVKAGDILTNGGKSYVCEAGGTSTIYMYALTPGFPTATKAGWMSPDDKAKLDGFGAASTYALKSDITSLYKHKGSVAAVGNLPTTGNATGDVYNVTATGMNYVWTGDAWDALGQVFTIASMTTTDINAILV